MTTQTEWSCAFCFDTQDGVAYVTYCLHRFCLGCIVRWAHRNMWCPLCRQPMNTIIYSVWSDEDYLEMIVPYHSGLSAANHQDDEVDAELVPRTYVADFPEEFWRSIFQNSLEFLGLVRTWLNEVLDGDRWWDVALVQGTIILNLCRYGLDEEALVPRLQPFLQDQTEIFVRQLINRCREEVMQRMEFPDVHAAEDEEQKPMSILGPTTSVEGTPSPNSRVQEEPHEELEQTPADPTATVQGRDCSLRGGLFLLESRDSGSESTSAHRRPQRRQQDESATKADENSMNQKPRGSGDT